MAPSKKRSLREGHRQAIGVDDRAEVAAAKKRAKPIVTTDNPLTDRYELLRDVPRTTIRKAWFTLSHLMLEPGATLVDMGCQDGAMAYCMAVLNPECHVIGVDADKKLIQSARNTYHRGNLEFICGDVGAPDLMPPGSVNAIVNSFILHEIYSGSQYNDRPVVQMLENQFALLKPEGLMYIRDFAMPTASEYVLMEMPDIASAGPHLDDMSEADLLVWYSEHARPRQDPGCTGFFLEELPPRFPKTRLFRLPSKWAYEFVMRKDERARWEDELPKEYTFFTEREYRKTLRGLGGRVLYTAPHWDEQFIKAKFDGHFRIYDEMGNVQGTPPTSFIAIAQKIGDRVSLRLNERRPSTKQGNSLRVNAMRNEVDGRIVDVISRDISTTEILPYRVTENGELNIFVHTGVPRGIINAVPRNGRDLDGKRWSGHMTETIALSADLVNSIAEDDIKGAVYLMRDMVGLRPMPNRSLERGPAFYPAPDFIDERIETRFIEVEQPDGPIEPKSIASDLTGFQSTGRIIEISAQHILNAVSVGIIPNAQLEMQILALYQKLGLKAETWADSPLALPEVDVEQTDIRDLMVKMSEKDARYSQSRGSAGQWRTLQSIFVDEGHVNGALTGLASRELDFAVSDETTENIAVILPLVKSMSGEVLAGFVTDYLPVPQRYKGSGFSVSAPTLSLPREITSMDAARNYIANHFKVKPENITRMGESFFCHLGVTPQRIYPFAMTAPIGGNSGPFGRSTYAPLSDLWKLMYWDNSKSFMKIMSLAYKRLGENSDLSTAWDFSKKLADHHERPVAAQSTDMRGLGGKSSKTTATGEGGGDNGGTSSGGGAGEPAASIPEENTQKNQDQRKPLPK
jgi:SAM-dependent methyltransferase